METVVGVLATPGLAQELADGLGEELREALRERLEEGGWNVAVPGEPLDRRNSARDLVEATQERMRGEEWRVAVCLTDLPLRVSHRPVVAHASAEHRAGLVSIPALGAFRLRQRVTRAIVHVVDALERGAGAAAPQVGRDLGDLSDPRGREQRAHEGGIRFTTNVVRGNLRLLAGMVRANNPAGVIIRLSRALAAALGTAAFALSSSNSWMLADGMSSGRLIGLSVGTLAATCAAVIVVHDLWQRSRDALSREQIVLANIGTLLTVLLGVITLYIALFVICAVCGGALIPEHVLESQIGHGVGVGDYVKLAWFASTFATLGGALGSVVESDLSVREAMYGK